MKKYDLIQVPKNPKILFENKWISLCETSALGYPYIYTSETRCKFGVATILPFKLQIQSSEGITDPSEPPYEIKRCTFLGHYEERPCHAIGHQLYSFTGGMDEDETPEQCAVRELLEESGYRVKESDLIDLGVVRPHKAVDTVNYLYAVDLTGLIPEDLHHDGSALEQKSYNRWIEELELIESVDPLVHSMYVRWQHASK